MALDIYWEGHAAGKACAGLYSIAIKAAPETSDLGVLAGLKLESAIRRNELKERDRYWRSKLWRTGFWDGFMDRAEQVRAGTDKSDDESDEE